MATEKMSSAERTEEASPVSFDQEARLLREAQPGNQWRLLTRLHVIWAQRLTGWLHQPALQRSLATIMRRHEVLRAEYGVADGIAYQTIVPEIVPEITRVELDVDGLPADAGAATRILAREAVRPIPLDRAPLLRIVLVRLGRDHHALMFAFEHFIADVWSLGILSRELATLYNAALVAGEAELPDLPLQFADFARWQRRHLVGPRLERLLSFWARVLSDRPLIPELSLPGADPAASGLDRRAGRERLPLPPSLGRRLRDFARRRRVTLYMCVLTALGAVLHLRTGKSPIGVMSPFSTRTRSAFELLIGNFANVLPVYLEVSQQSTLTELLAGARSSLLAVSEHQELPYALLFARFQAADGGRPPLRPYFMLDLHRHVPSLQLDQISAHDVMVDPGVIHVTAVSIAVIEDGDRLTLVATYEAARYPAAVISRLLADLRAVLQTVAADSERPIGSLGLDG